MLVPAGPTCQVPRARPHLRHKAAVVILGRGTCRIHLRFPRRDMHSIVLDFIVCCGYTPNSRPIPNCSDDTIWRTHACVRLEAQPSKRRPLRTSTPHCPAPSTRRHTLLHHGAYTFTYRHDQSRKYSRWALPLHCIGESTSKSVYVPLHSRLLPRRHLAYNVLEAHPTVTQRFRARARILGVRRLRGDARGRRVGVSRIPRDLVCIVGVRGARVEDDEGLGSYQRECAHGLDADGNAISA